MRQNVGPEARGSVNLQARRFKSQRLIEALNRIAQLVLIKLRKAKKVIRFSVGGVGRDDLLEALLRLGKLVALILELSLLELDFRLRPAREARFLAGRRGLSRGYRPGDRNQ